MITGDHVDTACAIAKELGILKEGTYALTGAKLNEMSDEELQAEKIRLLKLLKEEEETTR